MASIPRVMTLASEVSPHRGDGRKTLYSAYVGRLDDFADLTEYVGHIDFSTTILDSEIVVNYKNDCGFED